MLPILLAQGTVIAPSPSFIQFRGVGQPLPAAQRSVVRRVRLPHIILRPQLLLPIPTFNAVNSLAVQPYITSAIEFPFLIIQKTIASSSRTFQISCHDNAKNPTWQQRTFDLDEMASRLHKRLRWLGHDFLDHWSAFEK
jgi:hypothetical protein